jgi:rhodanese-related sulfurtransferase
MDHYLADARSRLDRVAVEELEAAIEAGALVVDIRPIEQRERDGELQGAVVIQRNVLEWRLAQSSSAREFDLDEDSQVIIVCNQGYQSSLAAATLQDLGLRSATDLVGGYQALIGGPYDPNG